MWSTCPYGVSLGTWDVSRCIIKREYSGNPFKNLWVYAGLRTNKSNWVVYGYQIGYGTSLNDQAQAAHMQECCG